MRGGGRVLVWSPVPWEIPCIGSVGSFHTPRTRDPQCRGASRIPLLNPPLTTCYLLLLWLPLLFLPYVAARKPVLRSIIRMLVFAPSGGFKWLLGTPSGSGQGVSLGET